MVYRFFGRNVAFACTEALVCPRLRDELCRYREAAPETQPDWTIRYTGDPAPETGLRNPRLHHDFEDGFQAQFPQATIRFILADERLREIRFHLHLPSSPFHRIAQRWLSMQYTSRLEYCGQIFHEQLLLPSVYFDPDRFLLHASAFAAPTGEVILVGGTGGVGKTSLELEMCRRHGYRFVADDLSVVGRDGHVWPNLAYPKIYGYNLQGHPGLKRALFQERGAMDRLHWRLHRRRGLDRVRRRVAPDDLYGAYSREGGRMARYVILAREARPDLHVAPLSADRAASLSLAVLDTEFGFFHNHLRWHEFNRLLRGVPPSLTKRAVFDRWHSAATAVFQHVDCVQVRIPLHLDHATFLREVGRLLRAEQAG